MVELFQLKWFGDGVVPRRGWGSLDVGGIIFTTSDTITILGLLNDIHRSQPRSRNPGYYRMSQAGLEGSCPSPITAQSPSYAHILWFQGSIWSGNLSNL